MCGVAIYPPHYNSFTWSGGLAELVEALPITIRGPPGATEEEVPSCSLEDDQLGPGVPRGIMSEGVANRRRVESVDCIVLEYTGDAGRVGSGEDSCGEEVGVGVRGRHVGALV